MDGKCVTGGNDGAAVFANEFAEGWKVLDGVTHAIATTMKPKDAWWGGFGWFLGLVD